MALMLRFVNHTLFPSRCKPVAMPDRVTFHIYGQWLVGIEGASEQQL
jgi:hypothetical protein